MKRVLVLSYHDHPSEGHALSRYIAIKKRGYDAHFFSLIATMPDKEPYVFDASKFFSPSFFWYRIKRKLNTFFRKACVIDGKEEYCYFNTSYYYPVSAKYILNHSISNPDAIILGWCDYFISPQILYELYKLTKAKIIIPMVDAHILGGGCHYPCDCTQYTSGCKKCPVLKNSRLPQRLYENKMKYLRDLPFTLVGTTYDLQRASKVPFLKNKEMLQTIGTPVIPFVKTKEEARKKFNIDIDDFVILCGGYSLSDKRKGFRYLLDAINQFNAVIISQRKVTLLMLGKDDMELPLPKEIKIIKPGFLNLEDLFIAYYAADVFVSPSIDDSGPYMVNYSIACGTPVISFPIGIALDLVKHKETGYLANYLDAASIADGLREFYEMQPEQYDKISNNCINLMERLHKESEPWYLKVLE